MAVAFSGCGGAPSPNPWCGGGGGGWTQPPPTQPRRTTTGACTTAYHTTTAGRQCVLYSSTPATILYDIMIISWWWVEPPIVRALFKDLAWAEMKKFWSWFCRFVFRSGDSFLLAYLWLSYHFEVLGNQILEVVIYSTRSTACAYRRPPIVNLLQITSS